MIWWELISLVLLVDYMALMLFYYVGWLRTRFFSIGEGYSPKTKISIVVAARNEQQNIESCVRSLLAQNYPKELYEIIVVDDHSEDKTLEVLQRVASSGTSASVSVLQLADVISKAEKPASFKKKAISSGIQKATGDLIVTTDADCVAEKKWLSTVAAYYEQFHPKMITGPVAFSETNSWLEKWQSLDLCGMMAITAGAITNRFPNMCNGANLAYEKKAFVEVNGFAGIDKQTSGDDVLLMMKINRQYPGSVHFLKSQNAIVSTKPVSTLSELFQQRVRWLSKGTAFPDWRVSVTLVFAWLFNLSIVMNVIGGFFFHDLWLVAAISISAKTIIEIPLLFSGCSFFGKKDLLLHVLPAQVVHILYVILAGSASRFYKYKWKGRT